MEATQEDLDKFQGHPRQILAAMTWSLERAVGDITDKLAQEGLLENTLLFFVSDNGGAHNNQSSNLPLKGFKGNKFEGGHRVSFVVAWASELQGNRTYDGLTSSLDIYATALDAAGADTITKLGLDGVSLLPHLKGQNTSDPHNQLFWRKDKMAAVRVNNHKLIRVEGLPSVMYNLSDDLGEVNDRSDKEPTQSKELNKKLENWEKNLMEPLWFEWSTWDTVTWMIHQDLMNNNPVSVKNPGQLERFKPEHNIQ